MNKYEFYKSAVKGVRLPLAILDMDLLDKNIESILNRAQNIPIRIATKSIRNRFVLNYILEKAPTKFSGLMAYSIDEALWLYEKNFKNILVAYPYMNFEHCKFDKESLEQITFMVDRLEHLHSLNQLAEKIETKIKVCLDIDLSVDFPGIHFGVYRSALKNLVDVKHILKSINDYPSLMLTSVMGYEAQIAGIGEKNPYKKILTIPVRLLKDISKKKIKIKRNTIIEYIKGQGFNLEFVNGGGTGSIESTTQESCVSEVAVGSGFYSPLLFDYYDDFKHEPALFFALELTRASTPNIFTLAGGGYVASGSVGEDKLPRPYLPTNCKLVDQEGVGEVQTPLVTTLNLQLGDPIFFRHAKAGELLERFNEVAILRNGKIEAFEKSYRGEGKCFL